MTITNHASKEVYLANGDTSFYNANVTISSTGNGGVAFGNGGGVSVLASGKTISIGSGGFGADYLTLKKLKQIGTTAQTLTLTGTAIVNLVGCEFNGNLTLSAGGFLLKDDVFNSATTFTKTGTANCHSDGNNTYNGATSFANNGSSGRLRLSATEADVYSDHVSFNSTGQDVQVCYTGNNYFYKNLTSNSNKVVFNTSTGKVTLAGDTAQSLNGSYNYAFKKLSINKSANQVTANTTLSVDDTLFFVSGNLITTATNLLTMKAGSKESGASSNSFVSGPVKKIGNTAFAYPVGRNASYRPIEISAPSTTTSEFTGEYLEDSVSVNTSSRESTLGYLNRNNYWKLNRQVGTSQVYVTLSWDTPNALVDTFVKVASWNGTQWKDLGKGIVSGNRIIGSVQSTNAAQSYLEFSLSYWNINAIPGAPNCSDVQNESDLRYCLTFTTSGSVQVTNNIFVNSLDPNGLIQLPFPVYSGVTLEGKNGSTSPKWWEPNCPLIITDHSAILIPNDNASRRSIYLFAMESGSTLQNLRIRGSSCNFKDFNQSTFLSGGILVDQAGNYMLPTTIKNCEVSCFSQAGIWKRDSPKDLIIENCYIQKVKGRSDTGIGYGVWTQGVLLPLPQQVQVVNFKNTIFDDCKAAIDGQGDPINWTIENCSFSQFFSSEDINMHNNNLFRAYEPPNGTTAAISDYHLCYTPPNCTSANCYYGIKNTTPTSLPQPQCSTSHPNTEVFSYTNDWIHCTGSNPVLIPIYDVAGATTLIDNSIFHKKVVLSGQSNITLRFPNRDSSKGGVSTNNITISNTIFATDFLDPNSTELFNANNKGGYARVAQNYIESCVWSGSSGISSTYNFFSYKPGLALQGSNFYPSSMVLNLVNTSNVALPSTYTHSATPQHTFMQYVALNTSFKITTEPGIFGSQVLTYIIRPNPNKNIPSTVNNVISDQNYYYEGEIITDQTSTTIPGYNKPGLYGIDVMGFDVAPVSGDYNFKASAWQHIPVIVQGAAEKILYFNIKDSYQETPITPTGVKKQAYLNGLLLWEEDIAEGGAGWEYVEIDLTGFAFNGTTNILDSIHTDGTENILSFSIYMEYSTLNNTAFAGVQVYVDDIYIPKTGSVTGDNLVKDGSVELSKENLCSECYWFQNLADQSTGGCGNTAVSINSIERKSGNQSLYLEIPFKVEGCTFTNSINKVVASIGTNIDFTDLLSCNDYTTLNFSTWTCSPCTTGTYSDKYIVDDDVTISGSVTINGSQIAILADKKITIASSGVLTITYAIPENSHLFACENMWEGIVVEPGGQLIIDGYITTGNGGSGRGTLIEGAKNAIMVDDGILKLRYAEFNHNYLSVLLKNDQDANSYIYGCKFNCIGGMIAKEPFMEHFPFEHIRLENVKNIEFPIGISTQSTGSKNYFSDAFSGIGVYNSSVVIYRNYFDNIYNKNNFYHSNSFGQAVNVENSSAATGINITIGGQGTNESNYFTNTNIGVRVLNNSSNIDISVLKTSLIILLFKTKE
ncbi:MAG: hypothetical protein IPP71_01695 [Bacteroidetes bacterium]|nr:hypothetical protein [Bacteroidota bacterium]